MTMPTDALPSVHCPKCLGDTFKILVRLDEETYEIAWYTLQGFCDACGSQVKLPTPIPLEV